MSDLRGSHRGFIADTLSFSCVDGPGNRFVIFLQGCNFDCIACHNPQTIPGNGGVEGHHPEHRSVDDVLDEIRRVAPFVSGVTVSGGEATQQPVFLQALFEGIRDSPELSELTCFVDSNGACATSVWDDLAPGMHGAMIDLKSLDDTIHREMTGSSNERVLASIEHLHQLDLLYEVRLLLIPGVNDDLELLEKTGTWLAELDPRMRIKVIGFRSHGVRDHDPPLVEATAESTVNAAAALEELASFELMVI